MRYMLLVRADESSEAGALPSGHELTEMGRYNEELVKAGVLLAADGLHPTSRGARVRFAGEERTVVDGPFAEAKELVAGFWIIQARSGEEAIEWAKRVPFRQGEIEVRRVVEAEEFGAELTPAPREQEERLRGRAAAPR